MPLVCVDLARVRRGKISGGVTLRVKREGVLHGVGAWFAATLSPSVRLSNAPPNSAPNWKHGFFPLEQPVYLRQGDHIEFALQSDIEGVFWRWRTACVRRTDTSSPELARFNQSNFSNLWAPQSTLPSQRKERFPGYQPRLSRLGEAELFLLSLFDGRRMIGEIQEELARHYADVFRSQQEAATFVSQAVMKYGHHLPEQSARLY